MVTVVIRLEVGAKILSTGCQLTVVQQRRLTCSLPLPYRDYRDDSARLVFQIRAITEIEALARAPLIATIESVSHTPYNGRLFIVLTRFRVLVRCSGTACMKYLACFTLSTGKSKGTVCVTGFRLEIKFTARDQHSVLCERRCSKSVVAIRGR